MFMIGSNDIDQTAKRMNVDKSGIYWRPAALKGHKRQFLGLGQGRSHGAVATVVPQKGAEVKGVLLYVPRVDRNGKSTIKQMDKSEGVPSGQYKRTTMEVHCYSKSRKLKGIINAEVYSLVGSDKTPPRGRAAIVGRSNRRTLNGTDPKNRNKKITYTAYNNGMVSIDYIKAVRNMLHCSWGSHYKTAKQFAPARGQSTLVMFDPSKCTYKGLTDSNGQKHKGACRGSQMFNAKVPKYSVLRWVRDNVKIKVSIPKMPSSRARLMALPLLGAASAVNATAVNVSGVNVTAVNAGTGNASSPLFAEHATGAVASSPSAPAASGPGRRLQVFV